MTADSQNHHSNSQIEPETLLFRDDGAIPNSALPALLYRRAFDPETHALASVLEKCFASNGWTDAWQGGVYGFHHFHSTAHEVLGVCRGRANLHLGGKKGGKCDVRTGDVLILAAGTGHQCADSSQDFTVVGAYPEGCSPDLLRGKPGERPAADRNMAAVPVPQADPLYGPEGPLRKHWK
ncbi:MAG: cupin protein [Verrucomicrobiales bacterium]|nr:cupin protein [Verrucomicrobiales bacterium]